MAKSKSVEVALTCSPDSFYNFFKTTAYLLPEPYVAGSIVTSIKLHGSTTSWVDAKGSQKSVIFWTSPGASESLVNEVQAVDDSAKSITVDVLSGAILSIYKTFNVVFQVTNANTVKWTATYEKLSPDKPDPDHYLSLLRSVSVGVNTYLSRF